MSAIIDDRNIDITSEPVEKNDESNASGGSATRESLYARAMILLGDRDFSRAAEYFDRVLDIEPTCAMAYWGSLLALYKCTDEQELVNCTDGDWTEDTRLKNSIAFATGEERERYASTLADRIESFNRLAETALAEGSYEQCIFWCERRIRHRESDPHIRWTMLLASHQASDPAQLTENCISTLTTLSDSELYQSALRHTDAHERARYEQTIAHIDAEVSEKKRHNAYEDQRLYMSSKVYSFKKKKEAAVHEQWKHYVLQTEQMCGLRNSKGKLYGGNIFSMAIALVIWGVIVYLVLAANILTGFGTNTREFFDTIGFAFGFFAVILIAFKLVLLAKQVESRNDFEYRYLNLSEDLEKDAELVAGTTSRESEARQYMEQYLKDPNRTLDEIEACRREFDEKFMLDSDNREE